MTVNSWYCGCSEWDASDEPSDCSVELRVSRPNWLCAEREEVLKKLYVPLTQLDVEGKFGSDILDSINLQSVVTASIVVQFSCGE